MVQAITSLTSGGSRVTRFDRDIAPSRPLRVGAAPPTLGRDSVEVSTSAARRLAFAGPAPIRMELVERLRREIDSGRYLTPEKLDIAARRLYEQLSPY